jgi:hypothetical protein
VSGLRGVFCMACDRLSGRPRSEPAGCLKCAPIRVIFPDQMAPIVRNAEDGNRVLVHARWGMPGPVQYGGAPVTNIRNVSSPHWRGWLSPENRCIVIGRSRERAPLRTVRREPRKQIGELCVPIVLPRQPLHVVLVTSDQTLGPPDRAPRVVASSSPHTPLCRGI